MRVNDKMELGRLLMDLQAMKHGDGEIAHRKVPCHRCGAKPGEWCQSSGVPLVINNALACHTKRIDTWIRVVNGVCPSAWLYDVLVYGVDASTVLAEIKASRGYRRAVKYGMVRPL